MSEDWTKMFKTNEFPSKTITNNVQLTIKATSKMDTNDADYHPRSNG